MKRNALIAVAIGVVASLSIYYVWCSWQWRQAAEQSASSETPETTGTAPTSTTLAPTGTPFGTSAAATGSFQRKGVLALDVRFGNRFVPTTGNTEHIALTATSGVQLGATTRTPANVVLVIDRSGSMSGQRISHARSAAHTMVDSLQDGDRVSVVTYSTNATVDVSNTILNASSRATIRNQIDRISVGGGTCVSCGMETGRSQALQGGTGVNSRIVLLSDGRANAGITDAETLSRLAQSSDTQGVSLTTIGVGLDYNEDLMRRVARSGNGNHYFVEDPTLLANTLRQEVNGLQQLVARGLTATFELAEGVTFVRGYDREFEVVGNRVTVSLGDVPASSERTALIQVQVGPGAQGVRPVSNVSIGYDELTSNRRVTETGTLSTQATSELSKIQVGIDPVVAARVEQAALGSALAQANEQLRRGNVDEARNTIRNQAQKSRSRNKDLKSEKLESQLENFEEAMADMPASAAAPAEDIERSVKKNAVRNGNITF